MTHLLAGVHVGAVSVIAGVLAWAGQAEALSETGLSAPGMAVHREMGISCTPVAMQGGIIVCYSLESGRDIGIWQGGERVSVGQSIAVVGVSRVAGPVMEIQVGGSGGERLWSRKIPVMRRADSTRYIEGFDCDKVDARTAEQKSHAARSWRKKQEAFSLFHDPVGDGLLFSLPARGRFSSRYGPQRVYRGVSESGETCSKTSVHRGLDIAAPVGRELIAPLAGVVTLAEDDLYYEGGAIFLDHGWGLVSVFMHLSSVEVESGQRVERGQRLGAIGATGRVTGPHLHWGVKWRAAGDRVGMYIDPEVLLDLD